MKRAAAEWLAWFAAAALLTLPAWGQGGLIGHPDVDVWNHAWGLWWWADQLASGVLPWRSGLFSHPGGGVLWFADPVGALALLPITLTLGPAVAWNALLLARVAWAGLHARRFAAVLGVDGPHTVLAGAAFATTPYLMGELHNGISEVCAVGWVPLVLTEWLLAVRAGNMRAWLRFGLALGLTAWATPYYALGLGLVVAPATLVAYWRRWMDLRLALPGAVLALALGGASVAVWRSALSAPGAVIERDESSETSLMRHNAVDLREPFLPATFRSVDYAAEYGGEQFRHSIALRLGVILLVGLAAWRRPRAVLPWVALLCFALSLGLGSRPFMGGRYVGPDWLRLPFGWLVDALPGLAITHPARLAVAAHAIAAALVADALRDRGRRAWVILPFLVGEGLVFSATRWPIASSPAAIPAVYDEIAASPDPRGVLDLPSQVRRTMATSVYFWFQTRHGHPVPWWPNVRTETNGDLALVRAFVPPRAAAGSRPRLAPLAPDTLEHLRRHYGWVVVHPELDRFTQTAGEPARVLGEALGAPERRDGVLLWRVPEAY